MIETTPRVFSRTQALVDSDIYVVGSIDAPKNYLEEFQTFKDAKEGENINMFINSGGGRLDTAVQYLTNMRNTAATTTSHLEGVCHSAATLLFLGADNWVVNPNALMLIHNYSGGAFGKGDELMSNVTANDKWVKGVMSSAYEGFLTEEEISLVYKNQDLWLESDEIEERLQGVVALREEKAAEHEAQLRASVKKQLEEINNGE